MTQHMFYDEGSLIDLRYLVAAEVFDDAEEDEDSPYNIGCLLEVGHTPQRVRVAYGTRQQRDEAFNRLIAMHQAWTQHTHQDDPAFE
jgi:hypothetical protein